ncbi:CHAP domain-containing protein [Actinomycetospora chiangmaiensis]|uniref:CHAP domain-containing protein n=1 Tax=Actinomycetospora chiangmaiensis TaxID=402650 RepID=UPI00036B3CFE|nr:CHAP domain-containing protein [Actinomycetospora chiangmaiensis]
MATGRHRLRLTPRQRIGAIVAALALLVGIPTTIAFTSSGDALAAGPSYGAKGVTTVCSRSDYSCTSGGYTGSEPWGYYTRYGSRDAAGRLHNCTTYVAFRLARNGVPKPSWYDNASGWATKARNARIPVDGTPTVGSIAQWSGGAGHVAYVEAVRGNTIELTDDMYGVNKANRWVIAAGSPAWPNAFIHFTGSGGTTPTPTPTPVGNQPVYSVMNTSETPPDGVWFRDNPNVSGPRLNGYGVYNGDRVQLRCYGWGESIGRYNDRLWYYSTNLTRPNAPGRGNTGWLNAHYVNDGQNANVVVPGVRPC